jgi:hypothetical protein
MYDLMRISDPADSPSNASLRYVRGIYLMRAYVRWIYGGGNLCEGIL